MPDCQSLHDIMKANFHKFLHQMRFKLLKSIAAVNNTPPPALPNSDQLTKTSFLKRKIQSIYKSVSEPVKFSAGTLSFNNSYSAFPQNREFPLEAGGGLNNGEESQDNPDNFLFSHLVNQNNDHALAFTNRKTENVTKPSVKTQQNPFVLNRGLENNIVVSASQSGFSHSQNINAVFSQAQNNIGVDTFISEEFKHDGLNRPEFQHFFFAQDAGGITQGDLGISGSNTGILGGHITESVTALQQMQDIGNGNSRAFDAGLAKPDSLFDDNTRGRGDFDNLVHSNDYNTNYGI